MLLAFLSLVASFAPAGRSEQHADDEPSMITMVVANVLSILLTHFVLRRDESRLTEAQRARAWLPASRMAALAFAPFALLIHYVRTRRTVVGFLFGVLVVACVMLVVELIAVATDALVTLVF